MVILNANHLSIFPGIKAFFIDIKPIRFGAAFCGKAKPYSVLIFKLICTQRIALHEDQSKGYASAELKHLYFEKLPFVYLSNGEEVGFTNFQDPKPRRRALFTFHRPETFYEWIRQDKS